MKCSIENMILHEIFTFSPLHFMLYHRKSISFGTVSDGKPSFCSSWTVYSGRAKQLQLLDSVDCLWQES